jgi:NitT/TauT family transport system substrate-binding protein
VILDAARPSRRAALQGVVGAVALGAFGRAARAAAPLRIATLRFGTVNWLLDTIVAEGLGAAFERIDLASPQALTVALQSGDVDVAVSDWPWAMRRRTDGEPFRFTPYSSALGALVTAKDSAIATLADLKGKRLGIAGGPLDKSWLLLRARAHGEVGGDLAKLVEPVFGAPPLLSEQLRLGRVDAVLTYWNFAARLDAAGYPRLIDVADVIRGLGIAPPPAMVGFVWRDTLLQERAGEVDGFFRAVTAANAVLASSDPAWERLRPAMQLSSEAEFGRLRDYFRAGIPGPWGEAELAASRTLYDLLSKLGGAEFVGPNARFDETLFWSSKA